MESSLSLYGSAEDMRLLRVVMHGDHMIEGYSNNDLCERLCDKARTARKRVQLRNKPNA